MEEKSFKKYIILWLSQSVSGLGSSMTGFALVLWAYGQSHSAMSVSLMSFCNYVPYVFLSLFVGSFIDRHKKKTVMLVSDSIAAAGSLAVLVFLFAGCLEYLCHKCGGWHNECFSAACVRGGNGKTCTKGEDFKCQRDEFFFQ